MTRITLLSSLLLLPGILGACGQGSLDLNVIFDDAEGIQQGHKVMYHGVEIGVVRQVELLPNGKVRVGVSIDSDHRERIKAGARFDIKKPTQVTISSERIVDVEVPDANRPPLPDGATVEGHGGAFDQVLEDLKELGKRGGRVAAEKALELLEDARRMLADTVASTDSSAVSSPENLGEDSQSGGQPD